MSNTVGQLFDEFNEFNINLDNGIKEIIKYYKSDEEYCLRIVIIIGILQKSIYNLNRTAEEKAKKILNDGGKQ